MALLACSSLALGAVYSGGFEDETGTGSTATGTAKVTHDPVAHTLRVQATFTGLTSNTTAAHIHATTASPFTGNAGVASQTPSFVGFPLGVQSGTFDNTYDLTLASSWNATFITNNGGTPASAEAALVAAMAAGRAYFNIHTVNFGGGEVRAWLPEPASLALLLAGGVVAFRRRSIAR
jgi:hypothetical protein